MVQKAGGAEELSRLQEREKSTEFNCIISQIELVWVSPFITHLPVMEPLQVYLEASREMGLVF